MSAESPQLLVIIGDIMVVEDRGGVPCLHCLPCLCWARGRSCNVGVAGVAIDQISVSMYPPLDPGVCCAAEKLAQ